MQWNGASCCKFNGMETETTIWSEFPSGERAIVEQRLASKKEINPKKQDFESHRQGSE